MLPSAHQPRYNATLLHFIRALLQGQVQVGQMTALVSQIIGEWDFLNLLDDCLVAFKRESAMFTKVQKICPLFFYFKPKAPLNHSKEVIICYYLYEEG